MTTVGERFKNREEFERVLDYAESNASTEWEMEFVESIRTAYDRYGTLARMSEKQEEALDRIAYKGK